MSNTGRYKEPRFEFVQDYKRFEFEIGYSYTKSESRANLIHITLFFWHLNFVWGK